MLRYEVLMLTIPEITEDEARSLETQFSGTVKAAKGSMISFERWEIPSRFSCCQARIWHLLFGSFRD